MDKPQCSVQEMLVVPLLQRLSVVAGWNGRDNRIGSVLNLAAERRPSDRFTCLVTGLTTEPANQLMRILREGLAGCVIVETNKDIGQELRGLADAMRIPLLKSSVPVSKTDLLLALELAVTLKASGQLADFVLPRLYSPQISLRELLCETADYICNPVAVCSPVGQVIEQGGDWEQVKEATGNISGELWRLSQEPLSAQQPRAVLQCAKLACHVWPLAADGQFLGFLLAFARHSPLNGLDQKRLGQTAWFCTGELCSRQRILETEKRYREQFVYDMLYNNFDSEELLIRRGRRLGWDFSKPQQILIIEADHYRELPNKVQALEELRRLTESYLRSVFAQVIVIEQYGQLVVIIPARQAESGEWKIKKMAGALQERLSQTGGIQVSIGIGKFYPSILDLCRSYQEAKQALELGRFIRESAHITQFEDLGIIHLLAHISQEVLDDYYKEYLAPVIEYDEKNHASFLETLQVYFQQNGEFNPTAEKLYMHPNTLRYRLRKIEELLGTDLQKLENRINLSVACKIARMRQTNQ